MTKYQKKQVMRQRWYESRIKPLIMPNISKNHPQYGMNLQQHKAAKLQRTQNLY